MSDWKLKQDLVEYGRRLWLRGYVAANDGNLSARLGADCILTTPTGVSKGWMTPEMLLVTDLEGNLLQGAGRPSSELKMHLEVYRMRQDIEAVVHAHPPIATAFSVAGIPLDKCVLPESVLTLGAIPIAPYATPSTDEIPKSLREFIPCCDAVLLANHGAVTWATSLESAYFRMETLEHTANILRIASQLGQVQLLDQKAVDKLETVREKLNLSSRVLACQARTHDAQNDISNQAELVEAVTQAVLKALG